MQRCIYVHVSTSVSGMRVGSNLARLRFSFQRESALGELNVIISMGFLFFFLVSGL